MRGTIPGPPPVAQLGTERVWEQWLLSLSLAISAGKCRPQADIGSAMGRGGGGLQGKKAGALFKYICHFSNNITIWEIGGDKGVGVMVGQCPNLFRSHVPAQELPPVPSLEINHI